MNIYPLLLGISLIVSGILIINLYYSLKKNNNTGAFSFKLRTGGIGLIIIGVGLILREII